jgi:hypothetical protein
MDPASHSSYPGGCHALTIKDDDSWARFVNRSPAGVLVGERCTHDSACGESLLSDVMGRAPANAQQYGTSDSYVITYRDIRSESLAADLLAAHSTAKKLRTQDAVTSMRLKVQDATSRAARKDAEYHGTKPNEVLLNTRRAPKSKCTCLADVLRATRVNRVCHSVRSRSPLSKQNKTKNKKDYRSTGAETRPRKHGT